MTQDGAWDVVFKGVARSRDGYGGYPFSRSLMTAGFPF